MNVKLLTITAIVASSALISACGGEAPKNTATNAAKPANTTTTAPAANAPAANAPAANAPAANAPAANAPAANAPATNAAKPANAPADMKKDDAAASMKDGDAKKDAANATAPKEGEKKDEKKP